MKIKPRILAGRFGLALALVAASGLWGCDDDAEGDGAGGAGGGADAAAGAGGAGAEGGEGGAGAAGGEGGAGAAGGEGGAGGAGAEGGEGGGAPACAPEAPTCEDEQILALALNGDPSARAPVNTPAAEGFVTTVDTTGGVPAGSQGAPTESYVYLRFTEAGLEPVAVGDEDAFASQDWDIALRRYLIRLNSGPSGPSCVAGARTAPGTDFDALAAVPEGLTFFEEQYMTETCEVIPDGSGLPSANTVLSSFWTYDGCLKMTGNVYVVALADGRHVKLRVDSYYAPANQATCDADGTAGSPSNAGEVTLRWAFLP